MKLLSRDSTEDDTAIEFDATNVEYFSIYFGYFFTALSIRRCNYLLLIIIVVLISVIVFSLDFYYNPFLSLFYKFYHIKYTSGKKILIITKKKIHNKNECKFTNLYRINDNSYIDFGGNSNE